MTEDARFEDGREAPLRLKALAPDDLEVISALAQDAVFPGSEVSWRKARRRFAILLNRFRWEDPARERHGPERIRSLLVIDDALRVEARGASRDAGVVHSLLSVGFEPGGDGTGRVELTLAGDGAFGIDVEALDVTLQDVTRPYRAPSGAAPSHPQ